MKDTTLDPKVAWNTLLAAALYARRRRN